jgi:hypothetical protein
LLNFRRSDLSNNFEMTSEEAKTVLSAYPPEGNAESDPTFAEALALVRNNPDLSRWFEGSLAFDRAIKQKLQELVPPAELESAILQKISEARKRSRLPPASWLALAAVLVFGGMIWLYQKGPGTMRGADFAQFKTDTMHVLAVQPAPQLDLLTPKLEETRAYIDARHAPRIAALPADLRQMDTAGCRVFDWRGQPVSLTCFRLADGKLVHLVVIDPRVFGSQPISLGWHSSNGWQTLLEKREGKLVMWASQEPMDRFKDMVSSTSA